MRECEDIRAKLNDARNHIKFTATRMLHTARTREDAENVEELIEAIADLDEAATLLMQFHPHRLEG